MNSVGIIFSAASALSNNSSDLGGVWITVNCSGNFVCTSRCELKEISIFELAEGKCSTCRMFCVLEDLVQLGKCRYCWYKDYEIESDLCYEGGL